MGADCWFEVGADVEPNLCVGVKALAVEEFEMLSECLDVGGRLLRTIDLCRL